MFRKLRLRIRALLRPDDFAEEMELHVAQLTDELVARGLKAPEARLAAIRQFGNNLVLEEQSHDLFSFGFVEDLLRDAHYAVRVFRRAPLFYAGAIFVLALGTGATCAISNLVYAVLLRPLPYDRPDEVVTLWNGSVTNRHLSAGMIRHWRESSAGLFSDLAIFKLWETQPDARFDLVRPDKTERVRGALVTPNFFSVLGAKAASGRLFTADDTPADGDPVVLSDAFWRREFGGDTSTIGGRLKFITGPGTSASPGYSPL